MVETVAEEMHEDWEPLYCKQLSEGIEAWNRINAANGTYRECSSRKWEKEELLRHLRSRDRGV